MTTVREAVEAEIAKLGVAEESPGLAAAALSLANQMDTAKGATAASHAAAQLRMIMADLRELAPVGQQEDGVTNLLAAREKRRAG